MVCIQRTFIDGYLYRQTKRYEKAPKGFEKYFVSDKEWEQRVKLLNKGYKGKALAPNTEDLL